MSQNSYSKFERLSTNKLEMILQNSIEDESLSPEDLLVISEILDRRDAGKGIGPPDVNAAWERFLKKKADVSSGSPPVETPRHITLRKKMLQRCAVLAACVLSSASIILATQAFGYDIVGAIVHRTADFFHFETVGPSGSKSEGLRYMNELLSTGYMPAEFTPSWLPEGFEKTTTEHFSAAGFNLIYVEYMNEDKFLTFRLTKYDSSKNLEQEQFEKQQTDVEKYSYNGKEYVLSKNGESEFWTAVWSDGSLVFQIQGDVTKEDLTTIIDFTGGTVS